jgi:hypothetical protein
MTKDQIDAVLERVHSWPKARQEDAARILLAMDSEPAEPYVLSDAERADIEAALCEVDRGEIAGPSDVEATFARHR